MDSKLVLKHTKERPFDDSAFDRYTIYDNMPYRWDPDLNIDHVFRLESGNLIKSYRCKQKEPFELSLHS